jgi:quercetin dioxygenase-like cupin family protein
MSAAVQVLGSGRGQPLAIVAGAGEAREVVGPSSGAQHRTMAVVELPANARTVHLCHPGEAVWYVVEGGGSVVADSGSLALDLGAMIHAMPGAGYVLTAGPDGLRVVGGPSPPDPGFADGNPAEERAGAEVRLFHRDRPARKVPMISSDARLVVFPGVGAHTANMNYVRLEPGEENVPHSHAESEDTIMILSGRGSVDDLTNDMTLQFEAGDVIHVPEGIEHRVKADRGSGVESVGGPCPPDRAMLAKAAEA